MPTRIAPEVEDRILAARRTDRQGQDRIGPAVGVPARTVSRVLRRHRVPYLRELDTMTVTPIRSSKTTAVRYERSITTLRRRGRFDGAAVTNQFAAQRHS